MATSKAYILEETPVTFLSSTGTVVLTLTSLATVSGRQSAQHDFGAGPRPFMFNWRAWVQFATAPVVGETVDFYLKTSNSNHLDNDDGTGDIALSNVDKLKNLRYIGSIVVDEAVADIEMSASGTIAIYDRYIHIVAYNATVDNLTSTALEHGFALEPISVQGQAT